MAPSSPPKEISSTAPTTRCTATRRDVSSTGTTAVTCRCTSSAATMCCARGCGPRTSTVRRGRNWRASSNGFASVGQKPGFAATAGQDETWCDDNDVDDLFGLSRNARLTERVDGQLRRSLSRCVSTSEARFCDFRYRTRGSWSRARRAVAKVEWRLRGARFVVTSLSHKRAGAQVLYEKLHCACGENRKPRGPATARRETPLRARGERNQGTATCSRTGRRPEPCSPAPLLRDFRQQ